MSTKIKYLAFLTYSWAAAFSSARAENPPKLADWKSTPYEITKEDELGQITVISPNVEAYFKERRDNTSCRQKYAQLKKAYFEEAAALEEAKEAFSAGSLEKAKLLAQEKATISAQDAFYEVMDLGKDGRALRVASSKSSEQLSFREAVEHLQDLSRSALPQRFDRNVDEVCGECTVPRVKLTKIPGIPPKYWYESHGFCDVSQVSDEKLEEGIVKTAEILRTPQSYTEIFKSVLTFSPFEGTNYIEDFGTAGENTPFKAFMAVTGPRILGVLPVYGYFIENTPKLDTVNGKTYFDLTFQQTSSNGLPADDVYSVSVTGEKKKMNPNVLKNIIGWWELNPEKKVIRYSTAAEFGIGLDSLKPVARRVHLDTVSTILHKYFIEEETQPQ